MNKKGFLLGEETLKIIIAVIAIILLIVFLVALYNNYTQNPDLANAKSSLNHLNDEINSGATTFDLYNPPQWILSSWSSSASTLIPGAANMPTQCLNNNWNKCLCLCIQPGAPGVSSFIGACNTKGICIQNDFSVSGDEINTGKNLPLILTINQQTKMISQATNGP